MKLRSRMSQSKLWLFVVVVIVVVVGVVGYRQYDSWRTSQKFNTLEQDIDILKAELEKQGIQDISKNKYCLRDSEKFGGGQLRCEIRLSWLVNDSVPITAPEKTIKNIAIVTSSKNSNDEIIQYKHSLGSNCYLISDEAQNFEFYCIDAVNKPIYPVVE